MPKKTRKLKSSFPKISIVTPSYNQAEFLEDTIKSVVTQDYQAWEYLIFDSASTDRSVSIIKKYAQKYPQIKWISQKDRGQVDAINQGLRQVTGDIIAYLNSDDYYLPGTFKRVALAYQQTNFDWLVGNCQITSSKLAWTFTLKHLWPIERSRKFLEIFNTINQPSVFLTKKLIRKVGYFNENYHYAFDYDYWLRASLLSPPYRLREPLAVFRIHQKSKGSTSFEKQFREDMKICQENSSSLIIKVLHWLGWKVTLLNYSFLK